MYSVKLKNTEAVFSIESIDIKNFYAYLNCSIQSPDTQVVPRGFVFKYVFNDREYPIGLNRYWVDIQPTEVNSPYTEINTNKLLRFSLKINLFGGNLMGINLFKKINFLVYESNQLNGTNERLFWTSPEITLISKNISVPDTTYTLTGINKRITVSLKHNWFSDYDFNYYSDDFKTVVEIQHLSKERVAFQTKFITSRDQQLIFDNIEDGYYLVVIRIILFNGFEVLNKTEELYIQDEKVKAYMKVNGVIKRVASAHYKATEDEQTKYWVTSTNQTVTKDNGSYWSHIIGTFNVDELVEEYQWPENVPYVIDDVVAWAQINYPSYNYPVGQRFKIPVYTGANLVDIVYIKNLEYPDTISVETTADAEQAEILNQINTFDPPTFLQTNTIIRVPVYTFDTVIVYRDDNDQGFEEKRYRFLKNIFIRIEERPVKKLVNSYGMMTIFKESVY